MFDTSGHWYTNRGEPFYECTAKDGHSRGVTLRDARKIGAVPSVTTVLQIIAKPQLATWKETQGILAALTIPRVDGETSEQLIARIRADSAAQAKAAAEEGTRIHDAIECAFKGQMYPSKYRPHVDAVMRRIGELFPHVTDWVSESSFAHPSGYGGKVDLHSPFFGIVIDYKGKDGDFSDDKRLHYDQHYQLAAYQDGLGLPRNVCANIFVSRTHPGKVAHHLWSEADIAYGAEYFKRALNLWKHHHSYDGAFQTQQAA